MSYLKSSDMKHTGQITSSHLDSQKANNSLFLALPSQFSVSPLLNQQIQLFPFQTMRARSVAAKVKVCSSVLLSYTELSLSRAPACTLLQITVANLKGGREAFHRRMTLGTADG